MTHVEQTVGSSADHSTGGSTREPEARHLARRRRGVRRPDQAPGHRAAAADDGAGDVLRRARRPAARPGRRDGRRRHAVGRVGVRTELRLRPRHRRADAADASPGAAAAHRLAAVGDRVRRGARRAGDRGAARLGERAVGGAGARGRGVLPRRLHDDPQAPDHPEHRLGRAGRLLPGADRLDGRHQLAVVGAGDPVPRRLLLDPAAHLGPGPAVPRGLRRRRRPDAAGRRARVPRSVARSSCTPWPWCSSRCSCGRWLRPAGSTPSPLRCWAWPSSCRPC